jgi:hypothetical protein
VHDVVVQHVEDEVARPRRIEADIAVAGAVGASRLRRGVETLAEVVSAHADGDDAQPIDLFSQPVVAERARAVASSAMKTGQVSRSSDPGAG